MGKPSKIIAVEEHILTDGYNLSMRQWEHLERRMKSMDARLDEMDRHGIDMHVLSLSSPGVHRMPDAVAADDRARRSNDEIAEEVARHPSRLAFFASCALQDPKRGAAELERAVTKLGARGAMLNHHTNGEFLDDEKFLPLWEVADALDVPVYIHPAPAMEEPAVTRGHPALGAAMWGWSHEIGGHALRLVMSGLFERFPKQQVILGHMAEMLPFCLWRLDSRYDIWPRERKLPRKPSEYIRENIVATTSGSFDQVPLKACVEAMGEDRVMFAIDYPYEPAGEAVDMLVAAPFAQSVVEKIAHGNAARVLKL
jgi:2,3-dihydroxybenzoate decarboxylase